MADETPAPAEESAEGGKKKKPKLLIIIIAAVALLAIGGGAGWYFLMHKTPKEGEAAEHVEEKKTPPVFVTLDPFTVNLASEAADRYLQVGMDLKVSGPEVGDKIKQHLPEIRNGIVLLLTSKGVEELASVDGKNRLREEVRDIVNKPLGYLKEPSAETHGAGDKKPEDKSAEQKPTEEKSTESKPAENADHLSEPPPGEPTVEKPKPRPAPKEGVLDVLLTSFVIQ